MVVKETLSEFVQRPTKVIARLSEGDVVLTRREGEDLVLRTADAAMRDFDIMGELAVVVDGIMGDDALKRRVAEHLLDAFPWLEFLPADAVGQFGVEFTRAVRACASVGNLAQLRILLSSWEDTAAIYADPERLAEARREVNEADLTPAPDPRTVDV